MTAIDYNQWAGRYDRTRGVSESVLMPVLELFGPTVGRSVLDIGGGTGNYSVALGSAGFDVVHCDPWPGMVEQAASKGVRAIIGDGQALPFRDGAFDCAVAIKVINHVPDRLAFVREARRVVRGGPIVLVHATSESIGANWITHYIPTLKAEQRFEPESATVQDMGAAGLHVEVRRVRYTDLSDGSAQALKLYPEAFLTDERIMNTSLLSRLPDNLRQRALDEIRSDYESGRIKSVIALFDEASNRWGDGAIFVGRIP